MSYHPATWCGCGCCRNYANWCCSGYRGSTMNAMSGEHGSGSSQGCRSQRPTLKDLNPVFHRRNKTEDNIALSERLVKQARKTGALNLSGRGLSNVPEKVYDLNETDKETEVTLESLAVKEEDAWWNQLPLSSLDLSSNSLMSLSPKIANLDSLTSLTLHDNMLTRLPKEIGKLEKLTRINLKRNRLRELPREFFTLPALRFLNLSHNEFEELDPALSDLHMLEVLDASNNKLTSIPAGIGFLVRLTELFLAHNSIKDIPVDLVDLRCLLKLDLMDNELQSLPEDIGKLRKLQCLYVQHNNIEQMPEFEGAKDLKELHISNNFIENIPIKFCSELQHLQILDLRDNKIALLPKEIGLLQNLTRLDLSNNSIDVLPPSLASLAHLVSLQLEGNPIRTIRRDILQCGTVRILKTLRDRASGSTSETDLPSTANTMGADGLNTSPRHRSDGTVPEDSIFPDKYRMRTLRSLVANLKQINTVPDSVFQTAAEEHVLMIDFSKNRLAKIPAGMARLSHCAQDLVLAHNFISDVPPFIAQFSRLSLVNLSCNRIATLPKEFGLLNSLRELNISNNRFEELPSCLYELKRLEVLLARDNRIKSIDPSPAGMGNMERLATLDLRNNNIESIPPVLGTLTQITNLDLIGNPFRQPRHQILERGTEAVMSYLRDRIPK